MGMALSIVRFSFVGFHQFVDLVFASIPYFLNL